VVDGTREITSQRRYSMRTQLRSKRRRGVVAASCLALLLVLSLAAAPSGAAHRAPHSSVHEQLARVRQATVNFHHVAAAERAGYVSTVECVSSPAGAMGVHYVNFALVDDVIEAEHPEILVYIPTHKRLRPVAVEYLSTDDHRPFLFGQPFKGQPGEYALHAWVWQANPAGVFADFNPKLSCPGE
jgi:hypothetical protein